MYRGAEKVLQKAAYRADDGSKLRRKILYLGALFPTGHLICAGNQGDGYISDRALSWVLWPYLTWLVTRLMMWFSELSSEQMARLLFSLLLSHVAAWRRGVLHRLSGPRNLCCVGGVGMLSQI